MNPMVSVVIPTYNQPRLLLEALESVRAQSFTDYETIVVNDGSTDDTLAQLAPWAGRLRIITQENRGIGAARNRGIAEARGKYVALLDHDDLWQPEKLAAQVAFMQAHPQCAAVLVPWALSTSPEQPVSDFASFRNAEGFVERPLRVHARGHGLTISSALMFDRGRAAGLRYREERNSLEDVPFEIGLYTRGALGIAGDRVLLIYRVHAANTSRHAHLLSGGVRLLRSLLRQGAFADVPEPWRADLLDYIGSLGRRGVVAQVIAGHRARGLGMLGREFLPQLLLGRWRFLAGAPFLLAAPRRVINRRWPPGRLV